MPLPAVPLLPDPPGTEALSATILANIAAVRIFNAERRYSPASARARFQYTEAGDARRRLESRRGRSLAIGTDTARAWFVQFRRPGHYAVIASAIWVSGHPANGLRGRIRQAKNAFHLTGSL